MFGEEALLGQAELAIDNKGRFFIPATTKREKGEDLVLLYNPDLKVYEIYSIKRINEMFEELKEKLLNSKNKTEEINYRKRAYQLSKSILRCEKVDNQGRILTGKIFEGQEKLLSTGAYDHLIIEPIKSKK